MWEAPRAYPTPCQWGRAFRLASWIVPVRASERGPARASTHGSTFWQLPAWQSWGSGQPLTSQVPWQGRLARDAVPSQRTGICWLCSSSSRPLRGGGQSSQPNPLFFRSGRSEPASAGLAFPEHEPLSSGRTASCLWHHGEHCTPAWLCHEGLPCPKATILGMAVRCAFLHRHKCARSFSTQGLDHRQGTGRLLGRQ